MRSLANAALILTCEHAGRRIPTTYRSLFRGAQAILDSHRGWDPGALVLARALARRLDVELHAVTWSRLLVEANRSLRNPRLWSSFTRDLDASEKQRIVELYWLPHRRAVEAAVARALETAPRVVHVAVHSFTPVLDGVDRNADVGLLYDPSRSLERAFCDRWDAALTEAAPHLRVRRNYPYRGISDCLNVALRRLHPPHRYAGIELEVNQALLAGPSRRAATAVLAETLGAVLGR